MSFNPYVFFSGNCADAFDFYSRVFGSSAEVMTHADLPPDADPMPGAEPHHVMHASIALGGSVLMGSDDPTGDGGAKTGIAVSFTATDPESAQRIFDGLAEGGEVSMPIGATFWSPAFGALTDKFGVQWMVDTPFPEGAEEGAPG